MKFLVVFASKHGQTRTIGEFVKRTILSKKENSVEFLDLGLREDIPECESNANVVIIGTPIYAGRFHDSVVNWTRKNKNRISSKRLAFFTVSLNAEDKHPEARVVDDRKLKDLIRKTGLVPNFVASFSGALNYLEYDLVTRWLLKRISKKAGGPIDTSRDYDFTNWDHVAAFVKAIEDNELNSCYSVSRRLPSENNLNNVMPVFEQVWSRTLNVKRSPAEVFFSFMSLKSSELRMGDVLAKIRNLGREENSTEDELFVTSTEKFGGVELYRNEPYEVISGLVGQFWRIDFGIKHLAAAEFKEFDELHYAKVVTQLVFRPVNEGRECEVYCEMRVHSTTEAAAQRFKVYWNLFRPGINLYMRSLLRAIKRRAEHDSDHFSLSNKEVKIF
tara:strand:- start:54 stop:1217 length:1164 start_codon:yes stop_codon:yes gene_type:complete